MGKIPIIAIIVQQSCPESCKLSTELAETNELRIAKSNSGELELSTEAKQGSQTQFLVRVREGWLWFSNTSGKAISVNDNEVKPDHEVPLRQLNFIISETAAILVAWNESLEP